MALLLLFRPGFMNCLGTDRLSGVELISNICINKKVTGKCLRKVVRPYLKF